MGTLLRTTDLQGMPKAFTNYLFVIQSNSVNERMIGMERVLALTDQERNGFGKQVSAFLFDQKNRTVQSNKFADFRAKLNSI